MDVTNLEIFILILLLKTILKQTTYFRFLIYLYTF